MKKLLIIFSFFIIFGCVQDSPNIQQIENLQFFIDNQKNDEITNFQILEYDINNSNCFQNLNNKFDSRMFTELIIRELFTSWKALYSQDLIIKRVIDHTRH